MATLLQHVKPWMQHAIEESAARIEQRMEHMMEQKVHVVYKRLDAFELRVLERSSPTVDVNTLQKEIESLCADITGLLSPPKTEPESAPTESIDDTMLSALFRDGMPPPDSFHNTGKHARSCFTSDDTEAGRASKRECQQTKASRRASIVDEELRQQQARKISVGASSSVSTTDGTVRVDVSITEGAEMVDASTTDGVSSVDRAGSKKPDPPIC